MKKIKLIYLKNQMLIANSIANFIGVILVKTLMVNIQETVAQQILESSSAHWTAALFSPFAFSFVNVLIFIGVGICLTILVSRNLSIPFRDIIRTLGRIRNGRFDKRVQVFSNDEIGYTGDAINEMTKGLIERERLQLSLNLAKEVQQNLLPKNNLKINGFDIAGKSVYCDETGGDYYDFISIGKNHKQMTGVAIGDVSGTKGWGRP